MRKIFDKLHEAQDKLQEVQDAPYPEDPDPGVTKEVQKLVKHLEDVLQKVNRNRTQLNPMGRALMDAGLMIQTALFKYRRQK